MRKLSFDDRNTGTHLPATLDVDNTTDNMLRGSIGYLNVHEHRADRNAGIWITRETATELRDWLNELLVSHDTTAPLFVDGSTRRTMHHG